LKVIALHSAGFDGVDVQYATSKGVWVTNTPDVVSHATADVAMAHLLNITRRFSESERKLRDTKTTAAGWYTFIGNNPEGKVLGILGMGGIGTMVAKRARGFEMKIIYHRRTRLTVAEEEALGVTYATKVRHSSCWKRY